MYKLRSSKFFSPPSAASDIPPGTEVTTIDLQPGLQVSLVSFQSEKDFEASAYNDMERIHFSYLLRGSVEVKVANNGFHDGFLSGTGELLTSFAPGERFSLHFSGNYRNIELRIAPETLSALAGSDYERIGQDIRRGFCIHRNCHSSGNCNSRACNAAIQLERLIEPGDVQPLLLHAAALEFLAWHLGTYRAQTPPDTISLRERKQLIAARERLLQDLSNPPTIAELSREIGLNQLKLKRGFKSLFGQSIYVMFQRERMNRAKVLLHRYSVTETAMMMGYSNISHFSSAFRKQFGILPREVRRWS